MQNQDAQIIGYRKDRLGARIIAIGNLLMLEQKFGVSVCFHWADTSEDHDMSINDPAVPLFGEAFQNRYIKQVQKSECDALDDLIDLKEVCGNISTQLFEKRLQKGEQFLCSSGLEPVFFANELGPDQLNTFHQAFGSIDWAPRINEVLAQAAAKIDALSGKPYALHVRRGDVLDKSPWCHRLWPTKFAPDEFYTAIMDQPNVVAVLFSDTPDIVSGMAAERPNAITIDDLIDASDLSVMQRDLVELLLMAKCEKIVAPALSAYSTSASMIGGAGTFKIPSDLTGPDRTAAFDAVLNRVLTRPHCFYNTGDFAQSVGYAYRHALNENQHHAIYKQIKSVMAQGQKYALYQPLVMALAIACGEPEYAMTVYQNAQTDPDIWANDLMTCAVLGCLSEHLTGDAKHATATFMKLYLARGKSDAGQDTIAHYFYQNEPVFQNLFLLDPIVIETLCANNKNNTYFFPASDDQHDGALNVALPLWVTGADWSEMFEKPKLIQQLTNFPDFMGKKALIPDDILKAELRNFQNGVALPCDERSLMLLSVYGVALRLSGRYRRATQIMFHCRDQMPDHPIFIKRLADLLQDAGKMEAAARNFHKAGRLLPHHPGVTIARAKIAQNAGDYQVAATLFAENSDQPILPLAYFKYWELAMRKLKSKSGAQDVIAAAYQRFPNHSIFEKKWANKIS
tara:strand:+ start:774 stop:2822 length:2049 start_codon:yes stop_codon:yes gene_type:complete